MIWLLQENLGNEDAFKPLIENLEKFGQKMHLAKVVPFVGEITPDLETDEKVICFGAYSMRKLSQRKNWNPGVYDIEWFPYQSLIEVLGHCVLNSDAVFGKFGEIQPPSEEFFMRPTHDGKEFAGVVKSANQLKEWQHRVIKLKLADNGSTLTECTQVMCAPLKKIYDEYRYFVVDSKAVTGSRYKLGKRVVYGDTDGNLDVAQAFVDRLSGHISHPYVLDIAYTDDGYKVIELNTLNCAGFYAADIQKLVNALINYENNH
jgi:hypothetical protein